MVKIKDSNKARLTRHKRVRGKISGTPEIPRLNVFRSRTNIYAQIIDDVNGVTLAAAASNEKDFGDVKKGEKYAQQVYITDFSMSQVFQLSYCKYSVTGGTVS